MPRLTLPAWARPAHPIVHYERRHWQTSKIWRTTAVVLWGGSLVFLLVPAACAGLFTLTSSFQNPAELVLAVGGLFTFGLFVISTLLSALNALCASILGATLISRERESQTWPFLKLTALTGREIALGKLMALYYTLTRPVLIITGLRLLAIFSGVLTLVLAAVASRVTLTDLGTLIASLLLELSNELDNVLAGGLFALAGLLVALIVWLVEPAWSVFYNGLIGLAASTTVRSRGAAIGMVFALHFVIGLGLYAPAQQLSLFLAVPFMGLGPSVAAWLPVGLVVGQSLLVSALTVGVLIGALVFSLWRVETLGE